MFFQCLPASKESTCFRNAVCHTMLYHLPHTRCLNDLRRKEGRKEWVIACTICTLPGASSAAYAFTCYIYARSTMSGVQLRRCAYYREGSICKWWHVLLPGAITVFGSSCHGKISY